LNRPFFVALDVSGNLYVGNMGGYQKGVTVTVYPPGASGDTKPLRTLQGPAMHDAGDMGNAVAVDGGGNLYLNDLDGRALLIYPPGADGSTPPVRTIKGPNTQLRTPRFIAVWPIQPASAPAGSTNPPEAAAASQPSPSGGQVAQVRQVGVRPSPDYKGPTPAKFEFVFAITADGTADVKWILLNFTRSETKELTIPVKVGVPATKPFQGWTKLQVYQPNKIESAKVPITADCRQ
jgi:hypothetical protein